MFFILSKILGFFALPSNILISIGIAGLVLLCTRFTRLGSWLVVTSIALIAVAGLSPLGNALILPLEQRFPPWDASRGAPDGIVVLGGAISLDVSAARGAVALNEAAERITATVELARRYPNARIIFSGGNNFLLASDAVEAAIAVQEFEALGIAHERITAEEQSRNTIENAVFSRLLANPQPGERWILVTSAYHMPRAIAAFPRRRLSDRSLSGRLAHARAGRCADAVSLPRRRLAPHRYGRSRVDRPFGLPDHRQDRRIVPGALIAAR